MNYYNEIKKERINNETYRMIKDYSKNKYELEGYYNVDKCIKKINYKKIVGIIIVKSDSKFVMEYCSNKKIFRTTYELI